MKNEVLVNKISFYLLAAGAVFLPLLLLPLGENFLLDTKSIVLFVVALVVFALWIITTLMKKTVQFTMSPFFFPLILLAFSVVLSSFYQQVIPMNQLLGFGGVYLAFTVIAFFGPLILPKLASKYFLPILSVPAVLLAVSEVAEVIGFGPSKMINMLFNFGLPNSPLFSLAGSPVIAAEFFAMVLGATLVASVLKKDAPRNKVLSLVTLVACAAGLLINLNSIRQQDSTTFLAPFSVSWSISTDLMKSVPSALMGVGPDNFNQAYMVLKPAWVNVTPAWNISYLQASNLFLSVFVTLGAIGLAAWIWLAIQVLKHFRTTPPEVKPIAAVVLVALLIELLLPPNIVVLGIQALALAFWILAEKSSFTHIQMHTFAVQISQSDTQPLRSPRQSNFLVYFISAICAVVVAASGWWLGRYIVGNYYAFQSVLGSSHNDAIAIYSNEQRAIQAYPYSASFRRSYSSVNMLIALTLAQKTDLSDQDKKQALGLVQQSIDEGKAAASIQPAYSPNWLNLARIYTNLVGVAEGADQWAATAYGQAITTAPTDPVVRLEAGGLLYRLKQPQQAVQVFEQTVALKPDWPNGYYNLAKAYVLNNEPEKAVQAYQQAIALLGKTPEDQKNVQAELDQLQKDIKSGKKFGITTPATTPPTASGSALLSPTATSSATVSSDAKAALQKVKLDQQQQ